MQTHKTQKQLETVIPQIKHSPKGAANLTDEEISDRLDLILGENQLTSQEERFVVYMASGMSTHAAGKAVGFKRDMSYTVANRPEIATSIAKYRLAQDRAVNFTIDEAHKLYMDAYSSSANATEMKNVVDSLVKLHGIGLEAKNAAQSTGKSQVNVQVNVAGVEQKSDEELLKMVGYDKNYLLPGGNDEQT